MFRSIALFVFLGCAFSISSAQAPDSLSYQGLLTGISGDPVADGTYNMFFSLYDTSSGGVALWTENHNGGSAEQVKGGIFNVVLGGITSLSKIPFDKPMYLGLSVNGDAEIVTGLKAVPYARALPGLYTYFADDGSDQSYNVVGGSVLNVVPDGVVGATIGGGGDTRFSNPSPNSVTGDFGTVSGGRNNVADRAATVSGGSSNSAAGDHATVGGGEVNAANGDLATVGGGEVNTAGGSNSTIGGGYGNTASHGNTTIGGGSSNTANSLFSTIAGGSTNTTGGSYATVGGGILNVASGTKSTVSGGQQDTAGGDFAMVPGGFGCAASGNYSFAAGRYSKAVHAGSFVWQDGTATTAGDKLSTTSPNQFRARASGGVFFHSSAAPNTSIGVALYSGTGTWTTLSSRASKTAFKDINTRDYLDRVASLDLKQWTYKTEDPVVTHVGPMAEDFYAAFGHGPNDESITTVDADGVALAAIQGLYELVQELQAENAQMRAAMARAGIE